MTFPEITTPRLLLNEIVEDDVEAVYDLFRSETVLEYYDLEPLKDISQATQLISEYRARFTTSMGIRWAIRREDRPNLIGTCGFKMWNAETQSTVLGYDLHPAHWGNGYATEAIQAVITAGFAGKLPFGTLHRIQAETVPGNLRSEMVLRKLGFKEEGLRRHAGYWKGQFHDLKCYGLLNDENNET